MPSSGCHVVSPVFQKHRRDSQAGIDAPHTNNQLHKPSLLLLRWVSRSQFRLRLDLALNRVHRVIQVVCRAIGLFPHLGS